MLGGLARRERWLLGLALITAGLSVGYRFVIEPGVERWQALHQEIRAARVELERHRRMIARRDDVMTAYGQLGELARVEGSDEEAMTLILQTIEGLARESGVRITDIKPQPVRTRSFYTEYGVELESEGTVQQLMKFIYELQLSSQMLRVDRMRLTTRSGAAPRLRGELLVRRIGLP